MVMMNVVIINPVHLITPLYIPVIRALKNDDMILFSSFHLGIQYTDTNLMLTDKLDLTRRALLEWLTSKRGSTIYAISLQFP